MFLVQDYNPLNDTFGPPLALEAPKEYGVPDGYDIPIFDIFRRRDIERVRIDNNTSVYRYRNRYGYRN